VVKSSKTPQQKMGAAGRDPAAIEKHQPALYRFLMRRLGGNEEARDLAQDVYLRFLQSPHNALVRQPQAYLYRIAANLVNEYALRQKREQVTYDSDAVQELHEHTGDAWTDEPGDQLNREQEVARLERVLGQLPAVYQAVLVLRTRDGLTREAIARELGLSPQTVKKYLFRAVAHCRTADWSRR
jgi:RNA polymerase sigma factor (sigma-70 family)